MQTRWLLAALAGALLGVAALPPVEAVFAPSLAHADGDELDALAIGTELVAVADVKLHQAEIVKGSKVSVLKLDRKDGHVKSVDVELADGHVVPRVQATTVRSAFRIAE